MIVIISASFCILGRVILQPQHLIPDGIDLLNYQASFLTSLSTWLLPLYMASILLAFFGSLYGSPEMQFRVVYEYLNTLPNWREKISVPKLRQITIVYGLVGGMAILWASSSYPGVQLIDIVTPTGILPGVLACGFYCLATPWTAPLGPGKTSQLRCSRTGSATCPRSNRWWRGGNAPPPRGPRGPAGGGARSPLRRPGLRGGAVLGGGVRMATCAGVSGGGPSAT